MSTENMYHTSLKPKDKNGNSIKPLDLVIINEIPAYYWQEEETSALKNYAGCYGLINYWGSEKIGCEPFYYGKKDHPGWISGDGKVVNVETRRVDECAEAICSYEFWIPVVSLRKIPFNSLVMNIFAEYPWEMMEEDGPSSFHFISFEKASRNMTI